METKQARNTLSVDFFLVSVSLAGRILKADILPGYKTDHSLCNIVLNYQAHPRGPGLWKLNSSLLGKIHYVNKIKSTILETVDQFARNETVDEMLLWEMIKLQIRDTSIKYSKAKIKKNEDQGSRYRKWNFWSWKATWELYKQRQGCSCWTIESEEKGITTVFLDTRLWKTKR